MQALLQLREVQQPELGNACCGEEAYWIDITTVTGSVVRYRTRGAQGMPSDRQIFGDSLQPFLDTLRCIELGEPSLFAARTGADAGAAANVADAGAPRLPPSSATLQAAPSAWSDFPGCFHPIPALQCADLWLQLEIQTPGTYELRAEGCRSPVELSLWSSGGAEELALYTAFPDHCSVQHTFSAAGSYPLMLRNQLESCAVSSGGAAEIDPGELSSTQLYHLRLLPLSARSDAGAP